MAYLKSAINGGATEGAAIQSSGHTGYGRVYHAHGTIERRKSAVLRRLWRKTFLLRQRLKRIGNCSTGIMKLQVDHLPL